MRMQRRYLQLAGADQIHGDLGITLNGVFDKGIARDRIAPFMRSLEGHIAQWSPNG